MPEPLKILYQDDSLVIIHKPAGHLVHPTESPQPDDLVAMKILRDQIGARVYSIHRIDRPTAGVLLFGIDRDISKQLHKSLADHQFQKTYHAVIPGIPHETEWSCHSPIQKHEDAPVRDAHSDFKLLASTTHHSGLTLSLIEATPHTGRFHQIRRHLLEAGHPIIGDYRYAGIEESDNNCQLLNIGSRMLLLAQSLQFRHPLTSETLTVSTNDPIIDSLFPTFAIDH